MVIATFTHVPEVAGFLVVMVGGPKSMSKRNRHHFFLILGQEHSVKRGQVRPRRSVFNESEKKITLKTKLC